MWRRVWPLRPFLKLVAALRVWFLADALAAVQVALTAVLAAFQVAVLAALQVAVQVAVQVALAAALAVRVAAQAR